MMPFIDPRDSYARMDMNDIIRELAVTRDLYEMYKRQRKFAENKHNRHLAKMRPKFHYESLGECRRAFLEGKIKKGE